VSKEGTPPEGTKGTASALVEGPPKLAPTTLHDGDVVWIVMPNDHARGDEFKDGDRRHHPWIVVSNPAVLAKSLGILHAVPLTSVVRDVSLDRFSNEHVVLVTADIKIEDASLDARDRVALCEQARAIDARRVTSQPGRLVNRKKLSEIRAKIGWVFGW
jgi:mRNA-degrading endonuclease toxin of MazEF toxin-antitoxin module